MAHLIIQGGRKLRGTITNQTSKNAAEAIICASVMIKGRTVLTDVPHIESVNRILELLSSIGVGVERSGDTLTIDARRPLQLGAMDRKAAEVARTSLLLMGALASRAREYKLYRSGGCHLGERTVRPHLFALNKLGVHATTHEGFYLVKNDAQRKGADVIMYESGDTTTENAVMAAVLARGTTVIKMASANYMVQDICRFLVKAGAKIAGIGTTTLTITGVRSLKPVSRYPIMPDPIAAMTFIAAAIVTHSSLTIKNCPIEFLELELEKLSVMGQKFVVRNKRKSKNGFFDIVDIMVSPSQLMALPDKVYGRPFPGLNIDNLALFIPILTQAKGRSLVHDWAYENRAVYALELQKLGAHITLLDPHRLWVEGPTDFTPNEIICPPALRPAVNVLLCMLAAKGTSKLRNTYVIDRGYENLYSTLNAVGAHITVMPD
jgi:UDP-N-acetylglucosamine 1-carboxyvinyltransferase